MAKRETPDVRMGLGNESLDWEGRIITLEYPSFYLNNAYSPTRRKTRNAGPSMPGGAGRCLLMCRGYKKADDCLRQFQCSLNFTDSLP